MQPVAHATPTKPHDARARNHRRKKPERDSRRAPGIGVKMHADIYRAVKRRRKGA